MEIKVLHSPLEKVCAKAILIPVFEGEERLEGPLGKIDEMQDQLLLGLIRSKEIQGKFREFHLLHTHTLPVSHVLVIGLGKRKDFSLDRLRSVCARGLRIARRVRIPQVAFPAGSFWGFDPLRIGVVAAEGALLGLYRFRKYVRREEEEAAQRFGVQEFLCVTEDREDLLSLEEGVRKGKILAECTIFARDLVNEPGNQMTPEGLAQAARDLASSYPIEVEVLDPEKMKELEMGCILAVAGGSVHPPRLIILRYSGGGKGDPILGFVGKGVTFDSGGISLKPAENMHYMRGDMAGAAAVIGALRAVASLRLPLNLLGVIPAVENLPDGRAYRPGDIIPSHAGKMIEILNTDAEGRLILADALAYARKLGASRLVDIATLTGGCVVALGHSASGVMGNNRELLDEVIKAGLETDEVMWQLPLLEEYTIQMKTPLADLKNSGGRAASPCTAAAFLKEFVGDLPWAHIDIAGTAMMEAEKIPYQQHPYLPKHGGTGVGVRTLALLAESFARKRGA